MALKKNTYTGKQDAIRKQELPELDVVKNMYADRDYTVELEIPEFTCVCPKTGLPDFATLYLTYVPDKTIVELKSLKLYITAFRNLGIFHENVINRISDDIIRTCKPRSLSLRGDFGVRGGIHASITREYARKGKKPR